MSVCLSVCQSVPLSLLTDRRSCYGMLDPERCILELIPVSAPTTSGGGVIGSFFDTLTLQPHHDNLSTEPSQPRKQGKNKNTRQARGPFLRARSKVASERQFFREKKKKKKTGIPSMVFKIHSPKLPKMPSLIE